MANPIERKRLKKKMLDRWENEGGRIDADPAGADETGPTSEHKGKNKQLSASRDNSPADSPPSSIKRKATRNY